MQISTSFYKAPLPYHLHKQILPNRIVPEIPHHPAHNVSILRQTHLASSRSIYPCGSLDPFTATASTPHPLPPGKFEVLFSCLFLRYSLYVPFRISRRVTRFCRASNNGGTRR
ncbi:hypothetical protein CEXT_420111 [Caerostris extrusa]|uniref:Uncharacterized protein n=1 Tax=Caerostris extrusa TaxID=172846 RepID=A0AAV4N8Z1_CAEEX|nr:hypothetical protein CEXT_420111 [Caerostris extrusa]